MKKLIFVVVLFLLLNSLVFANGKPLRNVSTGQLFSGVAEGVRAELKMETMTVRQIAEKFILKSQVHVSFYDPAGFEIKDVKAAVLNYKNSHAESGQIVPLVDAGEGDYAANIVLTEKGDVSLLVTMFTPGGEKRDFAFHYVIPVI